MVISSATSGSFRCSVAPWPSVRNGAKAVDFYKSAFGATEVFRLQAGEGVVARLSVDGAEFWVGDESPEHGNFSPESLGGGSVRMVLTVADPDAVFARALTAGASKVVPVREEHGWAIRPRGRSFWAPLGNQSPACRLGVLRPPSVLARGDAISTSSLSPKEIFLPHDF